MVVVYRYKSFTVDRNSARVSERSNLERKAQRAQKFRFAIPNWRCPDTKSGNYRPLTGFDGKPSFRF